MSKCPETVLRWVASAGSLLLSCGLVSSFASPAHSAEQDLQQWSLLFFHHAFDERWSASFQSEARFSNDISEFSALILKPGGYYRFSEQVKLGVGYKYQEKNHAPNEQDGWQEVYLSHKIPTLSLTHQFRLEERFIEGIDGVIPRVRYLIHINHPLSPSVYLAGSEAVRFNLTDKGEGPVSGFEQNRLYFGVGFKRRWAKIEVGYLWRYERERVGPDASDHVIRLQFLFDSKGIHPPFGGS